MDDAGKERGGMYARAQNAGDPNLPPMQPPIQYASQKVKKRVTEIEL